MLGGRFFNLDRIVALTSKNTTQSKTYIIPTVNGLSAIVLTLYTLIAGMVYANNLMLMLGLLLLMTLGFCSIITNFYLDDIRIKNVKIDDDFTDTPLTVSVQYNSAMTPENIQLTLYSKNHEKINLYQNSCSNGLVHYCPKEEVKRGCYQLETLRYSTNYPFNFFFSWKTYSQLKEKLYRFPKKISFKEYEFAKPKQSESELKQRGVDEFQGHTRSDQQNMSSQTDWKRYFSKGELWNKNFHQDNNEKYFINLNNLTLNREELEDELSQVTTEVDYLYRQGHQWELLTGANRFKSMPLNEIYLKTLQELASHDDV